MQLIHRLLRSAALLSLILAAGANLHGVDASALSDRTLRTASDPFLDASTADLAAVVKASPLPGIDAPHPATTVAPGNAQVDPGSGRASSTALPLAHSARHAPLRAPAVAKSREPTHLDTAGRLARAGLHTSALGTPPPQV
jgi:hypothetical protein